VVPISEGRILVTAQGHNGNTANFKLHLVLSHDWKKGIANYSYFDGSKWVEVDNVPAKLNPELKSRYFPLPLEPGPVILPNPPIMALYGVPIQSAIASGDLAHMKTLASYARQQLDAQPQLRKELDALLRRVMAARDALDYGGARPPPLVSLPRLSARPRKPSPSARAIPRCRWRGARRRSRRWNGNISTPPWPNAISTFPRPRAGWGCTAARWPANWKSGS
jgi:hypothetical protein